MAINILEVDTVKTSSGVVLIDSTNLNNPVPILRPELDSVHNATKLTSKAMFEAVRGLRRNYFSGSGQIDQKYGMDDLVVTNHTGDKSLYHTTSYPSAIPFINALATGTHEVGIPDRGSDTYFIVNGVKHKYGITKVPSSRQSIGDTTFPNTGGIPLDEPVNVEVVTDTTMTTKPYASGDMLLCVDQNPEQIPAGMFTTLSANVSTLTSSSVINYDAINQRYVINTNDAAKRSYFKITNLWCPTESVIEVVLKLRALGPTPLYITAYLRNEFNASVGVEGVAVYATGNPDEFKFTITNHNETAATLLICPNALLTSSVTDTFALEALSVKTLTTRVACLTDIPANTNLRANPDLTTGVKRFSRTDNVLIESWSENIMDRDFVYPLGCVQNTDYAIPGLPKAVPGTFVGNETYSQYGSWMAPGTVVGMGWVWSTLTASEQQTLLEDPDNNLYSDNGNIMQYRQRIRVVTSGHDIPFIGIDATNKQTPGGGVYQPITNSTVRYLNLQGPLSYIDDLAAFSGYTAVTGDGYGNTTGNIGFLTHCLAIPWINIHRRNTGIYHPVYNPNGCGMVFTGTTVVDWFTTTLITSEADCYNPVYIAVVDLATKSIFNNQLAIDNGTILAIDYVRVGTVASGITAARDNNLYADSVGVTDVVDKRINANPIIDNDVFMEEELRKMRACITTGVERVLRFEQVGLPITVSGVPTVTYGSSVGIAGYRLNVPIILQHIDSRPIMNALYSSSELSGITSGVVVRGDNGNTMSVTSIQNRTFAGDVTHIYAENIDSTQLVDQFSTLFPPGTVITYHTLVDTGIVASKTASRTYIIGDISTYRPEWFTDGIQAVPLYDRNGDISPMSQYANGNGSYTIPFGPDVIGNLYYPTPTRILVWYNGSYTAIPPGVDWFGVVINATAVKCYIDRRTKLLHLSITGSGVADPQAIVDAMHVLVTVDVTAKYDSLTDPSDNAGTIVTGDIYMSGAGLDVNGGALNESIVGTPGNIVYDDTESLNARRLSLTNYAQTPDNGISLVGSVTKHTSIELPMLNIPLIKTLPSLVKDSSSRACLGMDFEELVYHDSIDIVNPSQGIAGSNFGNSCAYDAGLLLVGAIGNNIVEVYEYVVGDYIHINTITAPAGSASFGTAIAITTTNVYISAKDTAGVGIVHIYTRVGNVLVDTGTLITRPDLTQPANSNFGTSLAVYADRLYIGELSTVAGLSKAGSVYVFDKAALVLVETITPNTSVVGSLFGETISVSNAILAIGASYDVNNGVKSGTVYLYDVTNAGISSLITSITADIPTVSARFGRTVLLTPDALYVSESDRGTPVVDNGYIHKYDMVSKSATYAVSLVTDTLQSNSYADSMAINGVDLIIGTSLDRVSTGKYASGNCAVRLVPGISSVGNTTNPNAWSNNNTITAHAANKLYTEATFNDRIIKRGNRQFRLNRFIK